LDARVQNLFFVAGEQGWKMASPEDVHSGKAPVLPGQSFANHIR
jgi:hypothetical protein